ncbi:MFS transporter [Sphingomonas sp. Leaf339]|uniref:spinster family MFS transporter n=1 Tax=Sphingomonas sp. Leaf339 TaxID=1736343 RepID=UPI00070161BD|nr:MFS transporter [Sphingomonas sp. Leaf339]KQU46922.1 MFS transporter [Sphingomonas sp. Leaf339]
MATRSHPAAAPPPAAAAAAAAGRTPPSARRAWFVLAVLCFVYVLNFLDRQLLAILAKPIRDELGLTHGQIGLISGLYFALFYCIISVPVAWFADRTNRVRVVSLACGLWSAATAACGLAGNYGQLATARMTVGVGEAGGVPPSYAIISDYFRPGTRGTALGLYNLGPPIGNALGVAFGASIAAAYSWRDAFMTLGVVGIVTAVLVFLTVREPVRGGLDVIDVAAPPTEKAPFLATCRMFFARPVLRLTALATGANQFITYATANFTTLFLMEEKGMTLREVAVWYALLVLVSMGGGIFVSGRLVDRFAARSKRAYALIPAAALVVAAPFFVGFVAAPSWQWAMLLLILPMGLNYFYLSPAVALVQEEVRPGQRVMAGALLLLVMNMIGLGLGPTYLGFASDGFRAAGYGNPLQMAFYTIVPFFGVAVLLFLALARAIRREQQSIEVR